jgi:hypothetical protein
LKAPIICIERYGIDNLLTTEDGEEVHLKLGAQVKVTLEAENEATIPGSSDKSPAAVVP